MEDNRTSVRLRERIAEILHLDPVNQPVRRLKSPKATVKALDAADGQIHRNRVRIAVQGRREARRQAVDAIGGRLPQEVPGRVLEHTNIPQRETVENKPGVAQYCSLIAERQLDDAVPVALT
jgi:type IV secretory pathway protease TraF